MHLIVYCIMLNKLAYCIKLIVLVTEYFSLFNIFVLSINKSVSVCVCVCKCIFNPKKSAIQTRFPCMVT
jgi:hypothetical protein